jgi:hypothetical protein
MLRHNVTTEHLTCTPQSDASFVAPGVPNASSGNINRNAKSRSWNAKVPTSAYCPFGIVPVKRVSRPLMHHWA